jgi:hypothetical protein
MIYVSSFVPDAGRQAEFFACIWQGERPRTLVLHEWLSLATEARQFLLIWEGDADAVQWVEERFGDFGEIRTDSATGLTDGLAACFAHDLDAFEQSLVSKKVSSRDIAREVDLRRRAMGADSRDAALDAAHAWQVEGADG